MTQGAIVRSTPQRAGWLRTAAPAPKTSQLRADVTADAVVIGAGYTGLNAAIRLTEHGVATVVLEAEEPGFGASGRNGGQVIPGLKHDPPELVAMLGERRGMPLVKFAGEAATRTFELIAKHRMDCDAQNCGWLQPVTSMQSLEAVVRRAKAWSAVTGMPPRVLGAEETRKLTGTGCYVGAWIDPRGGQLQPLSYARELARVALDSGVRLFSNSAATKLARCKNGWTVEVNSHIVKARSVLVCTNGYTGRLVPALERSFVPASSIMCSTRPLDASVKSVVLPGHLPVSDARRLLNYMRFDPEGRLMIGARGSFGLHEPERYFGWLRATAQTIFPALRDAQWEDAWGGRFALTLDHLPHIYQPEPSLFAALGCNGRGVAVMSQMGGLMADLVAGVLASDESPVPICRIRPVPLHAVRRPVLEAVALFYRALDRIGR
jgi:glycine/D-amino acid oxidase-like deaminating enzyme